VVIQSQSRHSSRKEPKSGYELRTQPNNQLACYSGHRHIRGRKRATSPTRHSHNRKGQGGKLGPGKTGEGGYIRGIDEQLHAGEHVFSDVCDDVINVGVREGRARRAFVMLMSCRQRSYHPERSGSRHRQRSKVS
jgi:hypothetical protein